MNIGNVGSKNSLRATSMVGGLRRQRTFYAPLTDSLFASGKGSTTPTFTRATTAYVPDFEGKLNVVKSGEARFYGAQRVQNFYRYTEDFSNALWLKDSVTNSTYGHADPFGGNTAMKLIVDNGSSVTANDNVGSIRQAFGKAAVVATISFSIYAKAGESHELRVRETIATGYRAVFNLDTGVVSGYEQSANDGNYFAQMTPVGDGWYRCQLIYNTNTSTTQNFSIKGCGEGTSTTGDGVSGLYITGAQCEDVTLSSVEAASPYVSNDVLTSPYHGSNVDGVKYFTTTEIHKQNLARRSEAQYDSTYWSNAGTAPTVHALSAEPGPFGGETTRIVFASGALSLRSTTLNVLYRRYYRMGAWVKSNTGTDQTFRLNIFNGLTSNYSSDFTATNEWQYFTHGPYLSETTTSLTVRIANGTSLAPSDILVGGVCAQEAVFNLSDEYIPNLGTYFGEAKPTGEYVNIPSTTTLGYLSEIASTNLLINSEDFSNASWTKTDITITADAAPAPDGYSTADTITEGSAGTAVISRSCAAYTANNVVSFSVYVRKGGSTSWIRLTSQGVATPTDIVRAWFNVDTGAIGSVTALGAATQANSFMEALPGGWYRCTVTYLPNALETSVACFVCSASTDATTTRLNDASYRLWGAQCETGPGPSTYIPTTSGSTVTRNSDSLLYPGTDNAPNAIGTAYAEATWITKNSVASRIIAYSGGAGATPILISTSLAIQSTDGTTFITTSGALTRYQTYKTAIAYGGVTRTLGRQGGTPLYDSAYDGDFTTGVTTIGVGVIGTSNQFGGCVRNVKLYKVKISNDALDNMIA